MKLWKIALLSFAATVALVLALALTGLAHGWVLLAYILFLAALSCLSLIARLRAVLPRSKDFEQIVAKPRAPDTPVDQYETVRSWVSIARYTQSDVYLRLRPLVRDIVAARLARGHGIDLEREPARAAALIGTTRMWELVQPDLRPPENHLARGWSERELEQLVEELEKL